MSALTTVGYNTVNVADFLPVSLMTVTLIMYFGASPSGTGGGLKSTTISAVFAYVKSKLSLQRDTYLFKHRIPTYRVDNALTTVLLYSFVLIFGSYLLSATERDISYIQLIFEAGSALGTVGLSTGITAELSAWSKIILVFLMYIGRVGVLTIGYSMLLRMRSRTKLLGDVETDLAI
jgi:trk system potassium uptake protein TrkH